MRNMRFTMHEWFSMAIIILAAFLLPSKASAGTYYVSPNGSSTWSSCTTSNVSCSWQTAMDNATAGDTVYFREGTYSPEARCSGSWEIIAMTPRRSGTASQPITFKAYSGESPRISPCSSAISPAFGARDVDYIIWDGFTGQTGNATSEVWYFVYWNSNNSIVRNMNFTGTASGHGSMANSAPIRVEVSNNVEVYNNFIHGINAGGPYNNNAGIWLFGHSNIKVHHNTIIGSGRGETGIRMKVGPSPYAEMYNNFIYNVGEGITISDQGAGSLGHKIHHNVIVRASYFAISTNRDGPVNISDVQVNNNTIYGSGGGIQPGNNARNWQIWNNIVHSAGSPYLLYDSGSALPSYSNYNDFYGGTYWAIGLTNYYDSLAAWRIASNGDANSVSTDPLFINPGGMSPADYKRTAYPTNGRGSGYESVMGAYVTGNERIGSLPRPVNLK